MAKPKSNAAVKPTNEIGVGDPRDHRDPDTLNEGAPPSEVQLVEDPNNTGAAAINAQPEAPKAEEEGKKITQTADELIKLHGNKSKAIRALSAEGFTRSQIASALGIRYQHVNNVLGQILKRPIKAEREAKKNGEANGNGNTNNGDQGNTK